jgi:hypothetical protein
LNKDQSFRGLYEQLANEYCKENHLLYQVLAPLIGLKPFYGTGNKEQIIWAISQEEANSLRLGENIYKFIRLRVEEKLKEQGEGNEAK